MNDFKEAIAKPHYVALYANLTLDGYTAVFEVTYLDYDEHFSPLPKGEKRESARPGYVRISEPVEMTFTAVTNDEVIQGAVAALDAEERQTVADLNRKIASIRERKQQLLAISFQPDVVS